MKNKTFSILSILLMTSILFGQGSSELISGKVSYVTSQNIYVKFKNTKLIEVGDTLQISKGATMTPCLVVTQKSSSSCVCDILNGCEVKIGDEVFFKHTIKQAIPSPIEEEPIKNPILNDSDREPIDANEPETKPMFKERIRGRISGASYSSMSSERESKHRMMYRLSVNASHIGDSKFSVETYINYRQNFTSGVVNPGQKTKFFRVYNLAARYDVDSTMSIIIGRKINNKASSLGAIDGVQAEKYFGNYYVGALAGFRPDIFDYNLNFNLLQYGGYFGRITSGKKFYSKTNIGLLEQRNGGIIDRRYGYFQHSSTINKKLNLFASFELDLYQKINEVVSTDVRLTNFYVSARYKTSRKINFSVSYDSRKRILYYETLKTDIERLLDDDEARQGIRLRVNVKPIKYLNTGVSYSKRFQNDSQNKSDNYNAFASYSKIPLIGGRISFNFNMNISNYLESQIYSVRHSRTIIKKKLNADFYFRMVNYKYLHSELTSAQQYYGANFSYRINRKLVFSILGELSARPTENNYRVNAKIIKRFDKK
jgi:hypothetical protein